MQNQHYKKFELTETFIEKYKRKRPPFGFNGLGELVYARTYSRIKANGKNERWWETVRRVVEGTYNIQKEWIESHRLEWITQKAQYSAQQMYDRIWSMKMLPPGRGLFAQGTDIISKKKLTPALYNCNAISTQGIKKDPSYPFKFTMDMLMCFAGNTMVNTANGPKRIDALNGLPYVAMVNDKPYLAPRGSWVTGKKEVFKIDTYDGYSITLTDNHPIQNSEGEWVEVKDLKEGVLLNLNTSNDPLNWAGNGNYKEGYLIGAFWGDGYQCSHNQIVSVNEKDTGFKGIQEEVLSCSTILSLRKDSARSWKKRSGRDEHIFNIGNSLASKYSFKKGSPKRLGSSIIEGSYDFYIGFLKGAFDSDGHVTSFKNKSHIIGLTQANHKDLKVIQDMLLRLGIASKINVKRKAQGLVTFSNSRVGDVKACWTLVISKDNVIKYNKLIGFSHTAKKAKLQNMVDDHTFNKESFTTKVKSVESKGIQTVWDTSINDLHALDANGFIAHNCGVGVGGDTRGAGTVEVQAQSEAVLGYTIPDSREGWVESLGILIDSFFGRGQKPVFDYSKVRKKGQPIKTFGGKSSGPAPLKQLHKDVTAVLNKNVGEPLSERAIVDIFNLIGKTVVAGNVRRSAILMAGSNNDEFLDLKDYEKHPDRVGYGWASNNSVLATLGMDYSKIAERICINGEPGLIWLENAHNNKRMGDKSNGMQKDDRTIATNPCGEIVLESGELCNLVEVFPDKHDTKEDFIQSLKYAYLYSKTITLLDTHWPDTNRVMLRNRRVGTSVSGVAQFLSNNSLQTLKEWLNDGYSSLETYDKLYSDWFAIPRSIRLSTNKPSGSISLLNGSTPGIHFPESRFYIRRVRVASNSDLIGPLKQAGYTLEPAVGQEDSTLVVEIPVDVGEGIRTANELTMWEQLELAAFMGEQWADNAVSVTITFDPETEGKDIEKALDFYQYRLKSVSFLPRVELGAYPQMPYEAINKKTYDKMVDKLKYLSFANIKGEEAEVERFCSNDTCDLDFSEVPKPAIKATKVPT